MRQKDEQISALQFTVEELQQQLESAEKLKADCVSTAVESAKASLEQDLRSQASELSAAYAELEACKSSTELRERQHQVSSHCILTTNTVSPVFGSSKALQTYSSVAKANTCSLWSTSKRDAI